MECRSMWTARSQARPRGLANVLRCRHSCSNAFCQGPAQHPTPGEAQGNESQTHLEQQRGEVRTSLPCGSFCRQWNLLQAV